MGDCLTCWLFSSVVMVPEGSLAESTMMCLVNFMSGSLKEIFHVGVGEGEGGWCLMVSFFKNFVGLYQ